MRRYLFSLITICCFINEVKAQVSEVSPIKPTVSDTIRILYHIHQADAKLKGNETIYARITNYLQDGSIEKFHETLKISNTGVKAKFMLPKLTAFSRIEFYTLNKDDETATQNIILYDKKKIPVKGAYLDALFNNKPDSIFKLEISNHPTNYYAYARYLNVISMVKEKDLAKNLIRSLLNTIDSLYKTTKIEKKEAGLLAAICIGNAKLGDLKTAKEKLFELFDAYPSKAETAFAFSIYNYEYYKSSSKQIEDDVRTKVKMLFQSFPNAAICKNSNVFEDLRKEKDIPTEAFEHALLPQYESDEMPYYALGNLPELYIERNEKLEMAKSILNSSIKRFQDGTIQHQYRLNMSHYQMHVPLLLYSLAQVNLLQNDLQLAVINTSAAIQVLTGSNAEGNFMPLLLQVRSKAYTQLGNFSLAIADYNQLYLKGDPNALDSLKKLFPYINSKHTSFKDYLISIKPSLIKENSNLNTLANFSGTDLKGNKISLSDLKGKIVVLNVWGIGCGPCIAEMPKLNELVKEYAAQPNVVFVAITGDDQESLIKFFKTRKFDYRVINKVANSSVIFDTNALPVHMVIGKNGEIINRSIGAREDIKTFLKGIIDLNL